MSIPVLTTKLYIPRLRPELVSRPRLIERLADGFHRKLTLVSAPAGFGKTTLLSEWVADCERLEPKVRVAWLSLDGGDNDPTRFWMYVIGALQTVYPEIGTATPAALRSPQSPSIEVFLTGLINEIVEIPESFGLVLDDLHLITEQQIHDALTFLLENLPPQMHLVLSSRADPPWPLARLRARGEMTELRAEDLRFTPQEAATFLNHVMQLALSPDDVAALEARTEGWVAGLQMASLAMQGRLAMQARLSMRGPKDLSGFIEAFTGSHRFVLDYLVEEVLEQQSTAIQEFLLKTSILERMTASLCDAVCAEGAAIADQADSRAILAALEQANLFLIPLDDERHWYRYHHLFADLLRSRLGQTQTHRVPDLHLRASAWYEENGLIAEAVSHALQAGDVERVVELVEENALAMMEHGQLKALERWLNALPEAAVHAQPWLCVARAWIFVFIGQLDAVEPLLRDAEEAIAASKAPSEGRRIRGHIVAIRSGVANIKGDVTQAARLAREALECLPADDVMARGWVTANLGVVLAWSGDLVGSEEAFSEAAAISQAQQDGYVSVMALCNVAVAQMDQGQLRKAANTFREAIRLASDYAGRSGQPLPVVGYAYTYLAEILREWNDLEAAMGHVEEGVKLCKQWGEPQLLASGHVRLARVLQSIGDVDGAGRAIREAKRAASDLSSWYVDRVAANEVWLLLAQGDVTAASRWAVSWERKVSIDSQLEFRYEMVYRALSRVFIAQGDSDRALGLLARLLGMFELAGAKGYMIEMLILQAIALQAKDEREQALSSLECALTLAEPEGYVRIFIDQGAPVGRLLSQMFARGIAADYVSKLLVVLDSEIKAERQSTEPFPLSLVEPLTERELEVLRLLTTSLSSSEIAEELFVSVHTVRSHIKNIYSKLGVHSRTQAVVRAQSLGLL